MTANEIREKYLKFFENKKHERIDPSPLVLGDDPTTLFTSSGMQKLVPYLKGKKHPKGKRLVDSQPCLRTQDIDEVGDSSHTTLFEMLGNWSLGDYFKKDQIAWIWEFLIEELNLPKDKLWVSVFEGTKEVPKDEESAGIWKKLGVPESRIKYYGVKENWWSRSGTPKEMPDGEIGGPDSEVFFEFTQVKHDPKFGKECHPNCQCGRFLEIGNSVFIEYKKTKGKLEELSQKNVDFGGGLERLAAAVNNEPDIFQIDIFKPLITLLQKESGMEYADLSESMRVVADHLRAAVFLAAEGLEPSNKIQGYVLRRLIRRAVFKLERLDIVIPKTLPKLTQAVEDAHPNLLSKDKIALDLVIRTEADRFQQTLHKGVQYLTGQKKITAKVAFNSLATYGLPFEVSQELAGMRGQKIERNEFEKELEKHKKLSRSSSAGMFKGGLADQSEKAIRLHTTTHLLHWALRKVLGGSVRQEGSNITAERLRFDFSHKEKLIESEMKKVEKLINEKIEEGLPVKKTIENKNTALKSGALAFFKENYPEKVSVYSIGKISKEFCGGPHVKNTSEIGRVRIKKQDKIGSNLIRIYAVMD